MSKCRLCLNHRKKVLSIFTSENENTFCDMIASISKVKIQPEDEFTKQICLTCCKKLREAYTFKINVERCDEILLMNTKRQRINFNTLDEVKLKIGIDCKSTIPKIECVANNIIKDGENWTTHCNTLIKRINVDDKQSNNMTVKELIKNFKAEPHDNMDIYASNDYCPDDDDYNPPTDSEDEPLFLRKKKNKLKAKKKMKKGTGNQKNCTSNEKNNFTPIKPVLMNDLKMVPTKYKRNSGKQKQKRNYYKKNICPYCGKLCSSLNTHILQHIGERSYACDKCPKSFLTSNQLKAHSIRHELSRNHKCDLCVAAFLTASALKSHIKMHTAEKNHICHICSKGFKRKCALNRHVIRHNFAGKSFKCDLCNMSFHETFGLRHHMRVHTGERPYKCEICSQPYSYKHDFNRHCFKKHGVFLKRRSINIMNEEVLKQERALMKDLTLRAHGILKDGEPLNPFEGPQAAQAFQMAIKAIESRQIPIDFQS